MDIKTSMATDALFVGAWALQSFTEMLSDGSSVEPMGRSPQGFLLYTEEGMVSAQLTGRTGGSEELSSSEAGASGGNPEKPESVHRILWNLHGELGSAGNSPYPASCAR